MKTVRSLSKCFIFILSAGLFSSYTSPYQTFSLSGAHFASSNYLPKINTCDSAGLSPALEWKNIPSGTKSIAITMHHIAKDGERHVYMVLYNIPPTVTHIEEGANNVGIFGNNSMNPNKAYTPPCSKGPGPKAYIITAFALSEMIQVESGSKFTMTDLEKSMEHLLIAKSSITATYSRPDKN